MKIDYLNYPKTIKKPKIEIWYGTKIVDPYSWLEENSSEVFEWEDKQNKLTHEYLNNFRYKSKIKKGLEKWLNLDQFSCPFQKENKIFQWRRKKEENHFTLYVGSDLKNQKNILDPNKLDKNGATAIDWISISNNGEFVAYGISQKGTEQSILKIVNVNTSQELSDQIPYTRNCSLSWLPNNNGFYYSRYPKLGTVSKNEENFNRKIFLHRLGSDWKDDKLIFKPKDPYNDFSNISVSEDGKWLSLNVIHGWTSNDIYIAKNDDFDSPNFIPLVVGEDNHFSEIIFNNDIYLLTDHKASNFRVIKVSCEEKNIFDKNNWQEVIPEQKNVLSSFNIFNNKAILEYQVKACSDLKIVDLKTKNTDSIKLPTLGTITSISGEENNPNMFYSFESYAFPPTVFKLNLDTLKQEKIESLNTDVDLSKIKIEQVIYHSKDKTPITMFIVRNKNTKLNKNNKTILTGYGGFNINETPLFNNSVLNWINSGGIYAVPNLRGGGEYGEKWHRDGMLDKKQNVFDDFVAAAEYLIQEKYTQPKKLAINGGSNGGLLVGAVMVQRPELFGAIVCQAPLLDMVHYDHFKLAKQWVIEYGDPLKPDHFKFLYKYSPYHHVVEGINYPPILLITADNDIRVDPMHARKMVAKLQDLSVSDNPVLLLVEKDSGHDQSSSPINKKLEILANIYTFLEKTLQK